MAIENGQQIDAADFLETSDGSAGKVPKTKVGGKIDGSFLPGALSTCIPYGVGSSGFSTGSIDVNTTAKLGLIYVPENIVVSKLSFYASTTSTPGTIDIVLYTDDGQTQVINVTSGTIAANSVQTITLGSAVELQPGNYYVLVCPNGTTNTVGLFHNSNNSPFIPTQLGGGVTGEPKISGTLTITAGTPPATFDPTAITAQANGALAIRLDA
ncbi:hypothetical protein ACRDNQ_04040 [Palleronia sp. KMU-117]|uniref:hypothetical protein n=1 Tax=Palleronia sp. KMU-117 TaxID=3434108 RepID=UPI003D765D2C